MGAALFPGVGKGAVFALSVMTLRNAPFTKSNAVQLFAFFALICLHYSNQ